MRPYRNLIIGLAAFAGLLGWTGCKSEPEHREVVITETQHEGEVETVSPGEMISE